MKVVFPWRAGMVSTGGLRVDAVDERGRPYRLERDNSEYAEPGAMCRVYGPRDIQPARDAPATLGALLGVVREERNEPRGFVLPPGAMSTGWVYVPNADTSPLSVEGDGHSSEFDALIDALVAARRGKA